jgi:hypothetical protein
MEKEKIDFYLSQLNWKNKNESIEDAIVELTKVTEADIPQLIFPRIGKGSWDYCAEVLKRIGFPKLNPYVPTLLEWFQDPNWPGWEKILSVLKESERGTLIPALESALGKAIQDKDEMWVDGLRNVLLKCEIRREEFRSKELFDQAFQNN